MCTKHRYWYEPVTIGYPSYEPDVLSVLQTPGSRFYGSRKADEVQAKSRPGSMYGKSSPQDCLPQEYPSVRKAPPRNNLHGVSMGSANISPEAHPTRTLSVSEDVSL